MRTGTAARFVLAAAFIALAAVLLQARGPGEIFPSRLPIRSFPMQLGPWSGVERPIDKAVLEVLGPGEFTVRDYYRADDPEPTNLYIAYFPSQRTGDAIHSPKNCIPGDGWTPVGSSQILMNVPGHAGFPANRYIISKGDARRLVLYWFWAHDRGVASEYWAKFYLVNDALRMNRSDGALVRIVINMHPGETLDAAQQRVMPFAADVIPLLNDYIPR
jgi:EpsI family protein